MPTWQQNAPQVWPRNGTAPVKDAYPFTRPVYDAQRIAPSQENPSGISAYGGYRAKPLPVAVQGGNFGRWDALGGRLMEVSQADTWDASPQPFPACGVWDQPGAGIAASRIPRLAPSTSAHPGLAQATGAGPVMQFVAPPVFSIQTRPIYAIGL